MTQNNATARSYPAPAQDWERPAQAPQERKDASKQPRRQTKAALKTRTRVKIIITVLLVFGICAGLVTRYAQLAVLNTEINKLDATLKEEQANLETLELQKTYATNLSEISENAKAKLGMDFPRPDQIVYIQLQQDGVTSPNEGTSGDQ